MTLLYPIGKSLYVNITNLCCCKCVFCVRDITDSVGGSDSLWLDHEPTMDELKAKRDRLKSIKTLDELKEYKLQKEEELQDAKRKKNELEEISQGISFEDATKIEKLYNERCEQWKKRKLICRNIVDVLSENMGEKPSQVYEDLDLETDENNGYVLSFKDRKYTINEV